MSDPTIETRETYDAITAAYARVNSPVSAHMLDDVASFAAALRPGSMVADIGCGPGHELALLREYGLQAIGLDLSIGQLQTGHSSGVAQADMRHLPLRSGSLDAAWCRAALLHLPHHTVPASLGEFARAVRPGGLLHLMVAEGDGEGWEVASHYGSTRRRWFAFHREPALAALLAAVGFEVDRVRRAHSHRTWLSLYCRRTDDPLHNQNDVVRQVGPRVPTG